MAGVAEPNGHSLFGCQGNLRTQFLAGSASPEWNFEIHFDSDGNCGIKTYDKHVMNFQLYFCSKYIHIDIAFFYHALIYAFAYLSLLS